MPYGFDVHVVRPITRPLEAPADRRAANVSSLDEVPDSTWFTNRIGARSLDPAEVRRGASPGDAPAPRGPWKVQGTKVGGRSVGFVVKDADGVKYLMKFDPLGYAEVETSADVVASRLLWACGYNVPENAITWFRRDDIALASGAEVKDVFGDARPMTEADLEERLRLVERSPDGAYRALVSKFVPGKPIGGYAYEGTRDDDPNDVIPHEHRRDVRGQQPIFAWLNHTDVKDLNTLDTWIEDPKVPGRRYVVHYLIDFGKALGALGAIDRRLEVGHAYAGDVSIALRTLTSLGLWVRPWEDIVSPPFRGVGLFESRSYDPGAWRANGPYLPFSVMDRFDGYWGAKIVARFTRDQIAAAVDAGLYSDPRAREYLVDTLIARQRKTARYWFDRVAPLDAFALEGDAGSRRLCFTDLAREHGLDLRRTAYAARSYDREGRRTGWETVVASDARGRACVGPVRPSASRDGYTIVRLRTWRGDQPQPPTLVHLAVDPRRRALRIIGVRRL